MEMDRAKKEWLTPFSWDKNEDVTYMKNSEGEHLALGSPHWSQHLIRPIPNLLMNLSLGTDEQISEVNLPVEILWRPIRAIIQLKTRRINSRSISSYDRLKLTPTEKKKK